MRVPVFLQYWLGRITLRFSALLPERVAYGVASLLGQTYYLCSPRRRQAAMHMLRNAFPGRPDKELQRIGRISTGNLVKVAVDMVRATKLIEKGRDLGEFLDVSELRERAPKPPFIGITGHIGSWEMGAVSMAAVWHEVHVIVRVVKNPRMQAFLVGNRHKVGVHLHPRRGGIKGLARALARNAVGLQAVDQNQRLRGVFVPFFGELASTERSAVSLSLRHGYPLLVGRCERIGPGFRFRVRLHDSFVPKRTDDKEGDIRQAAMEVNRRLEEHILSCPEQYLWIHDRYKTQPEDAEGLESSTT